jgi:hypothetical protein
MRITQPIRDWLNVHWFEVSIFLSSFLLRFLIYHSSSFANGWDAYFYIVQIKSYVEEDAMHSNRISLFYPLLLGWYYLLQDYELVYQLVSALIVGAFSLQLFRTANSLNSASDSKYLIAAYTLFSPHLTFVGSQFPKNLLGVVVLLVLVEYLIKSKYLKAGMAVLVGFFVHKMTAGLSIVLLVFFPLAKLLKQYIPYLFMLVIASVGVLILFPDLIQSLSFGRDGFGFGRPVWHGWEFIKLLNESITGIWIGEIVFAHLLFLLLCGFAMIKRNTNPQWIVLLAVLLACIFPLLEWSALGLSYRLLMVFLILAPLLASYFKLELKTNLLIATCSIFTVAGVYSTYSYPGDQLDPPYGTYKYLTKKIEELETIDPELIIIHKSFAEYYTFKTGRDALPWIPEYEISKSKLWRVAYGINLKTISYYADDSLEIEKSAFQLSPSYVFLREDLWSKCIRRIEQEDPDLFLELSGWKNPDVIRPDYLLKNKEK